MEATKTFFSNFFYGFYLVFYVSIHHDTFDIFILLTMLTSISLCIVHIQGRVHSGSAHIGGTGIHMVPVKGEEQGHAAGGEHAHEPVLRPKLFNILMICKYNLK